MASAADVSLPRPQVRTCNLCRQRRVKCDRRAPQCSNCLRSDADCVYPPGRGRAPKRPKRVVAPQVSERLSRLEGIIHQLNAIGVTSDSLPVHETAQVQEAGSGNVQALDQNFSRLKVDDSKSYYVNNALWVTLSDEIEELHDLLFEPASDDVGCEPTQTPCATTHPTPSSSQLGLNAAIFGYQAIPPSFQHFHPSLPQAAALFAAFTDNVAPLVHIFHLPTLTRIYWDAVGSLGSLDRHTETLLFAIHYSALVSLSPDQCLAVLGERRDSCLQRYQFAVEQALARGNLLGTQNMTMLQAAVLFLSALPNEDDSRAVWSLTSLLYHIARTMGLHRDGTAFGLQPLETELRRRLWWQICIIDSRSSEYHCNEPTACGFASDTKPPLHIDDADLSPDMQEPPPERWDRATDMTLTLVRCEAIQTGWKLGFAKEKQIRGSASSGTPTADGDSSNPEPTLPDKNQVLVQNLETRLHDKYLPICDSSVPFQLLSSAVSRIILARFRLITQYSAASRRATGAGHQADRDGGSTPGVSRLDDNLRNELFHISTEIVEVSGILLTNPAIAQWTWYSKTHIQWGAMAFVLSELCARPPSPECDRTWDCVRAVYDGWRGIQGGVSQDDEGRHLCLWRPIRRLMAKARYVRELQHTNPAQPTKTSWRAQQPPPDSAVPGPYPPVAAAEGFLAHYPPPAAWCNMPTPELSLSGPSSSAPNGTASSDDIQRVLGREPLGLFMDLLPDWPWADTNDGDAAAMFVDMGGLGLPPTLS